MKPRFVSDLEARARAKRHEYFISRFAGVRTILDVGGTADFWRTVGLSNAEVTLLNLEAEEAPAGFTSLAGDARDLSRFGDKSFDLVFSNSVIGHVGGFDDQRRMASEIARVGRSYFVQTPNHGFPVDWRTLVPFFHFLSPEHQAWCFKSFAVGTYRRAVSDAEAQEWATRIRNIRRSEIETLFPGATVRDEAVFGFTKSFMIHN